MKQYIFPCILIACNLGAGIVCGITGNAKMSIYWIAAAVLNATVTF